MKPTININIAGYPFTMDDDAYRLLKDYLETIRDAFKSQNDNEDLASDIEARIAEILLEKENGNIRIVSIDEISKVIERIGQPSQFIESEEDSFENKEGKIDDDENIDIIEGITPPPYDPSKYSRNPFVRKRIYRDPQNAMLGGVCAGIAQYLHVDVTIIRLIAVLLLFLSASTVAIIYIILWIVIPEARTPIQRMQMMGEDATVENIGKTVTGNYKENVNQEENNSQQTGFSRFLSSALSIFIKILIFLGLLIAIPVLIALSAGLIGCIIAVFIVGIAVFSGIAEDSFGPFDSTLEGQFVFFILLAVIGGIITLGIPMWLLFKMLWNKKDNSERMIKNNPTNQRILLVVWLCGIALLSVFTVKAVKKGHQLDIYEKGRLMEKIDDLDLENINISNEEITIKTKEGKTVSIGKDNSGKHPMSIGITVEDAEETVEVIANDSIISENSVELSDSIK